MPGPDNQDERRDVQLHNGLFWGGVGLAPIAALLLLLGQEGGPLRIAAVLAILAVVLIGLSITLRSSSDTVRVELEETLYEEVDALRRDVREDITTAARATHKAFGEKLQALYEQVTALRAQLDALRAEAGPGGYDASSTMAPAPAQASAPAQVGGGVSAPATGSGSWSAGTGSWSAGGGAWSGGSRPTPPGVVRHTETVQVTTRQTIVDPAADEPERGGTVYGGPAYGRHGRAEETGRADQHGWDDRHGWGDQQGWADQQQWGAEPPRSRRQERVAEPTGEDRWSGARAGDRWAAVRDDERGREVRMGERRAAVQSDDRGTEMRIEDRWAAVRREDSGHREGRRAGWGDDRDDRHYDGGGRYDSGRDDGGWRAGGAAGWRDDGRREVGWRDAAGYDNAADTGGGDYGRADTGWQRPRRAAAALPAGGVGSAGMWDGDWAEAEREPVGGRRYRDEDASYRYAPEPEDRWR